MVVPLKYLLIHLHFSNQMPGSCCFFIFRSTFFFSGVHFSFFFFFRFNSSGALHEQEHLVQPPGLHQEGAGRRAATSVLQEWFGRWHLHTWRASFTSSPCFTDLFIMPSFHLGWTETPCLHSLLYPDPPKARELKLPDPAGIQGRTSLSLPCAQLCQGSSSKHQCKCHKLCAGQLDENLPVQCAFSTLFPLTLRASH